MTYDELLGAYQKACLARDEARNLARRLRQLVAEPVCRLAAPLEADEALRRWARPPQPTDEPPRDWQVPPPPRTDLLAAIGDIVVSYFRSCGRCLLCKGVNQEHGEYCGVAIYLRSVEVREPADEPTSLQQATAAVLDEAGMTLADEPCAHPPAKTYRDEDGEWHCEVCEAAADEPKGERPAVAYVPATRWSSR